MAQQEARNAGAQEKEGNEHMRVHSTYMYTHKHIALFSAYTISFKALAQGT